jgi:hypothetical protein
MRSAGLDPDTRAIGGGRVVSRDVRWRYAPPPISIVERARAAHHQRRFHADSRLSASDTSAPSRATVCTYGPPTGKIWIANLLEINGQPSGPVDLYDVHRPESTDTPIITHLAYARSPTTSRLAPAELDSRAICTSIRRIRKQERSRGARTSTRAGFSRRTSSRLRLSPTGTNQIGELFVEEGGSASTIWFRPSVSRRGSGTSC